MSGISGAWRKNEPPRIATTVAALNAGLSFSPGDRAEVETLPEAGAGVGVQARFDGQETFRNERVLLACDAELVNEAELRRSLGIDHGLQGHGALLAALYERHGVRFVDGLRGAFSVILWDVVEHRLVAAIDGFGIKRLSWYEDNDVVLVATRTDVLRAVVPSLSISPRAIANILNFSSDLGPETIFTGVRRLAPGTVLVASNAQVRTESYWDMRYGVGPNAAEQDLSRELESLLQQSVSSHCAASPGAGLGAFLSGGTDSSTVVGLMTRVLGAPVKAFSIGFEEPGFSELEFADIAARAFASEHHKYLVTASDCLSAIPDIVRAFDEPFGNSSAVPTYFCARLAAENGVTTLVAGDGGDELFGGNERYATDKIFESYFAIPQWLRAGVIEPVLGLPIPGPLARKPRGYVRRAHMRGVERMLSFQFLRTHAFREVFEGDFLRTLGEYSVLDTPSRHYAGAAARDHLDRLLYVDMKITLADNDLPKVTCMSELAGVRDRFPFLDRSVAEFSGRVPARLKVKGFEKRYLFKQAFRNLLPAQIIRKKKHGFGIPVALWMRTDPRMRELAHDTLLSERAFGRGYFRRPFIEDLFRRHDAGAGTYYGDIIWTFLMLELWHRRIEEPAQGVA
jgi:asparagine synthase (glutamine-hydrolysing)